MVKYLSLMNNPVALNTTATCRSTANYCLQETGHRRNSAMPQGAMLSNFIQLATLIMHLYHMMYNMLIQQT